MILSKARYFSDSRTVLQDDPKAYINGTKFTPTLEEWHTETEKKGSDVSG